MLDIYHHPGHLVRRLHQISVSVFTEAMQRAGHDLTPVQYAALEVVAVLPDIDQATLAGAIAYDRATIGGVADRLHQKGLIDRAVSETDRRARTLRVTCAGEGLLEAVRPLVREAQQRVLSGLTEEEIEQFLTLARKAVDIGNALARTPMVVPQTPS